MTSRNVLVVALDPVSDEKLNAAIAARMAADEVNVHVVAPATHVGRLQWLTGAEDEARAEAEELADRTADAVDVEVETEVGDRDPLVAVEDALRVFPADEILVAGTADGDAETALRRFGLPISRVDPGDQAEEQSTGAEALAREVTQGRSTKTPFVMIGAVAGAVLAAIVLISLLAFLVAWFA
jgi:hypothetical protein